MLNNKLNYRIINLAALMLLLYIGVDIIGIHQLLMKLIATGIVMVYNFITRKIFIEKHDKDIDNSK